MTVNTIALYVLYGLASILSTLIALTCTKKDRDKFPLLRKLDGKKLSMTFLLIACIVVGAVVNIAKDVKSRNEQEEQGKKFDKRYAEQRINGVLIPTTNSYTHPLRFIFDNGSSLEFAGMKLTNGVTLKPFSLMGHDLPVTVTLSNGNLYVSAVVQSLDGAIVARLVNNEWKVPNNYFSRNYDRSAVEVTDKAWVPYLQVELLDNSTIRLGGVIISDTNYFISGRKGYVFGTISPETDFHTLIKKHCIQPWFAFVLGKRSSTIEPCPDTAYQVLAKRNLQPNLNEITGVTNWTEQWIVEVNTPTGVGTLRDAIYYNETNTLDSTVIAEALTRAKRLLGLVGVTNAEPTCSLRR